MRLWNVRFQESTDAAWGFGFYLLQMLEIVSIRFWTLWEQMFFISHPPSPTPHAQEFAYSWICVCGFDFYLKKYGCEILPVYWTMWVFGHLRLFSYGFASHINPPPSTSAVPSRFACKSPMQRLRWGNSGSDLWSCLQPSDNAARVTRGWVTGQNMPPPPLICSKAPDSVCSLISNQELHY